MNAVQDNSLNDKLKSIVEKNYDLKILTSKRLGAGNAETWRLETDNGSKFFKKFRGDIVTSDTRVDEVLRTMDLFRSKGIPVPSPFKTSEGESYLTFEGSRYILYPFVDGRHIPSKDLNVQNIESAAKVLAKIHLIGKGQFPELSYKFKSWKTKDDFNTRIEIIRQVINSKKELDQIDKKTLKDLDAKSLIVNSNQLSYEEMGLLSDHLVHGDYQEMNLFFDDNGTVKWVIDFDTSQLNTRSRELARAIQLLCFTNTGKSKEDIEKARIFFKSYNQVYPITSEELKKGFIVQFMKLAYSYWVYTEYYITGTQNAAEWIINEPAQELQQYWLRLDKIVSQITLNN